MSAQHPIDLLPDFVAGALAEGPASAVRAHLDGCPACRAELGAWQNVAAAAVAHAEREAPPAWLSAAVVDRVAREAGVRSVRQRPLRMRLAWLRSFVLAQIPLVRREIWPASTIVMAIGAAISLLTIHGSVPGAALSVFAPFAAALGIALIYGQENDPALELAVATPTSPRLVVVARLVVVLAWDLALALAASAVLAVASGPAIFMPLVSLWLGPMLLLGSLTLLLSLFMGTSVAISIAAVIWGLRGLQVTGEAELHRLATLTSLMDAAWQTTPVTLAAAAILLLLAIAVAPTRDPIPTIPAN